VAQLRSLPERSEENMKKRERNRALGVGSRIVVNEKAPGGYVARLGTVREIVLSSRYGIKFDNQKELTVYLDAECLDPAPRANHIVRPPPEPHRAKPGTNDLSRLAHL
jgi:hypothetical protein